MENKLIFYFKIIIYFKMSTLLAVFCGTCKKCLQSREIIDIHNNLFSTFSEIRPCIILIDAKTSVIIGNLGEFTKRKFGYNKVVWKINYSPEINLKLFNDFKLKVNKLFSYIASFTQQDPNILNQYYFPPPSYDPPKYRECI